MKKILISSLLLLVFLLNIIEAQRQLKVLMIIAGENFRDEEYFIPKQIFIKHHIIVITASTKLKKIKGMLGGTVRPDIDINSINIKDYDAIILPGGTGAAKYWNNKQIHKILKEAYKKGKIIAAECLSPLTLANAGLLKNKKATAFISIKNDLKKRSVIFTNSDVEIDGNIITSNGPKAAEKFAIAIIKKLKQPK